MIPSDMLLQISVPDSAPKQKSISELILEMAERETKEIAQLKTQALKPTRPL